LPSHKAPLVEAMQVRRATKTTSSARLAAGTTTGRFLIEDVYPSVDCGCFRVKRIAGEPVEVWADILRDGHELTGYLTELTRYPEREYYRQNFFVNTPDILPVHRQSGEVWRFKSRAAPAATLSASCGIYSGFEFIERAALNGREEYLDF